MEENQTIPEIPEKYIHNLFDIGVLLKGADGIVQVLAGFLLLLINPETINALIIKLTQYELVEDPDDVLSNYILTTIHLSEKSQLWAALFLLAHGLIKLPIIIGLIQNKLWAYQAAIIVFSGFVVYQMYRYVHTHAFGLLLISIFDLIFILLTWHEYKKMTPHTSQI